MLSSQLSVKHFLVIIKSPNVALQYYLQQDMIIRFRGSEAQELV